MIRARNSELRNADACPREAARAARDTRADEEECAGSVACGRLDVANACLTAGCDGAFGELGYAGGKSWFWVRSGLWRMWFS